ncbi:histone-arginine methyltransferase CARM1 [Callorhinchus milii]|uniref:histone-arginine methyltransferase CARM1 n=1 Tax=Callorhinchus milii TaxID=7868 RepID=UPI001C3F96AA|nr:histone-arginine methyltransferase CARM1 [Callorhinchus milii]
MIRSAGTKRAQPGSGDGMCVFKCVMSRETESCRVGKQAFLITVGYSSVLLQFRSSNEFSTFYNSLKVHKNSSKASSAISERTEDASASQYFQRRSGSSSKVGDQVEGSCRGKVTESLPTDGGVEGAGNTKQARKDGVGSEEEALSQFHGCLSQQQNTLQDYIGTATYQRAILENHVDFKDKVILDVGCGSGILSFFAVQAGARKVYAVEGSAMSKYAEILVKSNNLSEQVMVLEGKIEEISIPEKVDIIISEPMGYLLFHERRIESYLHAKKWLKPNGMMFPTFGDVHLAPFSDEQLYMEHYTRANFWYQQCFHGINLSSLRSAAVEEYFKQPIVDTFDVVILMARSVKYTVNFLESKEDDLHRMEIPFVFHILQSGLVHGLAFWFDVAFVGSQKTVWLSTSPTEPLTHWYQVRCLLQTPLFAKAGETFSGRVLLVANKRQSYDIHIMAIVDQTGFKSGNILDLKNPFFSSYE